MPAAANAKQSIGATWQIDFGFVLASAEVLVNWVTGSADPFTWVLGEVVESSEPVVEPVVGPVVGPVNGAGLASYGGIST